MERHGMCMHGVSISQQHLRTGIAQQGSPAHALKQAAPVVQRRCICWLDLQRPAVVCNCLLKLTQPVMAEGTVVVGAAVARVELDRLRVVPDGCLKAPLRQATTAETAQDQLVGQLMDVQFPHQHACCAGLQDVYGVSVASNMMRQLLSWLACNAHALRNKSNQTHPAVTTHLLAQREAPVVVKVSVSWVQGYR